jgi:hypothetical protein
MSPGGTSAVPQAPLVQIRDEFADRSNLKMVKASSGLLEALMVELSGVEPLTS